MFSIIDTETGVSIASGGLPMTVGLADGGFALFTEVGQIEPAHAPRYRCVERVEITPAPVYPHVKVSETVAIVDNVEQVSATYTPDQKAYQRAIDNLVEDTAKVRSYASSVSLASYVTSAVPMWKAEAEAFVAWRDQVWVYVLLELNKVTTGQRTAPALDAFLAELPAISWPAGGA